VWGGCEEEGERAVGGDLLEVGDWLGGHLGDTAVCEVIKFVVVGIGCACGRCIQPINTLLNRIPSPNLLIILKHSPIRLTQLIRQKQILPLLMRTKPKPPLPRHHPLQLLNLKIHRLKLPPLINPHRRYLIIRKVITQNRDDLCHELTFVWVVEVVVIIIAVGVFLGC
jgi:hypothetical protein